MWSETKDASGIIRYDWQLERYVPDSDGAYTPVAAGSTAKLDSAGERRRSVAGAIWWFVPRATDGAGNTGQYSFSAYFDVAPD